MQQNTFLSNLFDTLQNEIPPQDLPALQAQLKRLDTQQLNIMFVGATGSGKSSTINAIFNTEIATVGRSVNPETSTIQDYKFGNLVLWDTPGLGDSPENDKRYAGQIVNALKAKDDNGNLLIDAVVMIVDGSNRDLGTTYEVINNIIIPFIGDPKRMVVAINQCDIAMGKGHWNTAENEPDMHLASFLMEKALSVQKRIKEASGVSVTPVVYSALHHYNISKLLLTMLESIPESKRYMMLPTLNQSPEIWRKNDALQDYNAEIQKTFKLSITNALSGALSGAGTGAAIGSFIPVIGTTVGAAVGAALGFLGGLFGM